MTPIFIRTSVSTTARCTQDRILTAAGDRSTQLFHYLCCSL